MYIFALPKPGKDPAQVRQSVLDEFKRLATEGPTAEEMEKLRNNLLNDAVRGRQSSLYRAQRIAEYTLYDNDPNLFNTEHDRYLAVTAEQIKQAAKRYLDTDNYATLNVVPAGAGSRAAAAQPGQPAQPGTTPPTVPDKPKPVQTTQPTTPAQPSQQTGQPQQPTDTPKPQQSGTGTGRP